MSKIPAPPQTPRTNALQLELPVGLQGLGALEKVIAGAILGKQGQRPTRLYCVLQGELRLVRHLQNGFEALFQRVSRGFVAEASLHASRYHCDLMATVDSEVVVFPIDAFKQALANDSSCAEWWMLRLATEVRTLRSRVERLYLGSAKERILHYIQTEGVNGRLKLTQTKKVWAAELGMAHESLYRTLRTMEQQAEISLANGEVCVVSPK